MLTARGLGFPSINPCIEKCGITDHKLMMGRGLFL
jgi:hypothetical protein